MLEEMELTYELLPVDLSAGEQRSEAFLVLNPTGEVPVLVDDHVTIFESGAICQYLAERYPDRRMAPPVHTARRPPYHQWMFFAVASYEPWLAQFCRHTSELPEAERSGSEADHAQELVADRHRILDAALGDKDFFLGSSLSTVDILLGANLAWADRLGLIEEAGLSDYLTRIRKRPAYQRATAESG